MTPFCPEVAGHREARAELGRWFEHGRLPRGIALCGERGRGRRTLACALAERVLSQRREGDTAVRRRVASEEHPDLLLVGAADRSGRIKIEEIRHLREWFSLTPSEAAGRVAIVVDADRLLSEAGNALLKTLEEPPPGSLLILTTRSREALMETLASRCRSLQLPRVPDEEILPVLERRGADPERARALIALVDGRPGFAVELLESGEDQSVLLPARDALLSDRPPLLAAQQAREVLAEDAVLAVQRERLRRLLAILGAGLSSELRRRCGAEPSGPELGLAAGCDPQAAMRTLLQVARDLEGNVSPDLLLHELAVAFRA